MNKIESITAKTRTQLLSTMRITTLAIIGKLHSKLDKTAINHSELKIEITKTTNTNKTQEMANTVKLVEVAETLTL